MGTVKRTHPLSRVLEQEHKRARHGIQKFREFCKRNNIQTHAEYATWYGNEIMRGLEAGMSEAREAEPVLQERMNKMLKTVSPSVPY